MHAGLLRAGHSFSLAVGPDPPFHAFTPIANRLLLFLLVMARSPVQARLGGAVADSRLAVDPRVTGWALAGIRTLSGIEAGSTVLARFVVRAEVQILIAEQSTPAFIAETLPRFLAGSVHASRIGLALVAQSAFPAGLAYAFVRLGAVAVLLVAARSTAGFCAVISLPASQANALACW